MISKVVLHVGPMVLKWKGSTFFMDSKMHLLVVSLLMLATAVCQDKTDQQKQISEPIYTADSQWVTVSPADVGARFAMPVEPEYVTIQFDDVIKDHVMTIHQYRETINNGTVNFVFVYHDLHVPMKDMKVRNNTLDGAVLGARVRLLGKLLSVKRIKHLNRYHGREFVFVANQGDNILKFSCRAILVGQRLYQLNIVMMEDAFDQKLVNKYFDSFKLVKLESDLPPRPTKMTSK